MMIFHKMIYLVADFVPYVLLPFEDMIFSVMAMLHAIIIYLNQSSQHFFFKFPKFPNIPRKFQIFPVEIYHSQNSREFCIPNSYPSRHCSKGKVWKSMIFAHAVRSDWFCGLRILQSHNEVEIQTWAEKPQFLRKMAESMLANYAKYYYGDSVEHTRYRYKNIWNLTQI